MKTRHLFSTALFLMFAVIATAAEPKLDVPYVPTSEETVETMLKMANVGPKDLVYDLGCGDGRIVIMAVKKFGARGVGVDLDPERIAEAKENARKAGIQDRVEFIEQDLFKTDFSDATVLAIYLLPDVNLRLRPKILNEMRPGSRVVSHSFSMGDWQAEKTDGDTEYPNVYFWVVPGNVTGTWTWTASGGDGRSAEQYQMKVDQSYQTFTGSIQGAGKTVPIRDGKINGVQVQFTAEQEVNGKMTPMQFKGIVAGNMIQGMMQAESEVIQTAARAGNGRQWIAQRDPATVKALDGYKGQLRAATQPTTQAAQ